MKASIRALLNPSAVAALRQALAALPEEEAWKLTGHWLAIDTAPAPRCRHRGRLLRVELRDCFSRERTKFFEIEADDYQTIAEVLDEFHVLQRAAVLGEVQAALLEKTRRCHALRFSVPTLRRRPPQRQISVARKAVAR
jgi:hypothetical protein